MGHPVTDETRLLHAGGPDGEWGNLGLWPLPPADASTPYAAAAEALARRVATAAGLAPGDRVLSVACGAGEELALWVDAFGASAAVGVELDAERVQRARARAEARAADRPRITVIEGTIGACPAQGASFDRVLCVDAAYHLSPRQDFLAAAWRRLRPGGTMAWTDLVLDPRPDGSWVLRGSSTAFDAVARRAGVDPDELGPVATTTARLERLGASAVGVERLDAEVLDGFARFAGRQARAIGHRAVHPAWWRVAATAALIPRLRRAGLGYALFAARKPAAPGTPAGGG